MSRMKQLILGAVVPVAVLVFWQVAGSQPNMAGIVPTPLAVLEGFNQWVFGKPGMGLKYSKINRSPVTMVFCSGGNALNRLPCASTLTMRAAMVGSTGAWEVPSL